MIIRSNTVFKSIKVPLFALAFIFTSCESASHGLRLVSAVESDLQKIDGASVLMHANQFSGASGVKAGTVDGVKYYFKTQQLGLSLFDSIIASQILSLPFSGDQQRFPLITLGVRKSDRAVFSISQELAGYKTIIDLYHESAHDSWPFKGGSTEQLDDLSHLYAGLFLIGGGDPHPGNVAYSKSKNFFGDVDLDVAFKWHIPFSNSSKDAVSAFQSDLALKEFECQNPCPNFLYTTDSQFYQKAFWEFEYKPAYNYEAYQGKKLLKAVPLLRAMKHVTEISLNRYVTVLKDTIAGLKNGYKSIATDELEQDLYENQKIKLLSERYSLMKYLGQKFDEHVVNHVNPENEDDTYKLLKQWCEEYSHKSAQRDEL